MLEATLDEASLARFLDAFYARVRRDALIGPVFAAAIPDPDWPRHMATIQDFWSSVLFKTGRYKGNPFGKHLALGRLEPEHFARWLGLFEETASAHFPREVAIALIERAHRIGDSLKAGLFFRPVPLGASGTA
ncbi:group III truncated hemoglobin [Methylobacterium sp. CM6257]|jgi:hemoglobin